MMAFAVPVTVLPCRLHEKVSFQSVGFDLDDPGFQFALAPIFPLPSGVNRWDDCQ